MPVTVTRSGPAITEDMVTGLESQISYQLPTDYRAFLLAHNPMKIIPNSLPVTGIERTFDVTIKEMCCFYPGNSSDIIYNIRSYKGRIPAGFMPIGDDPGGNLFIMGLEGERRGQIHFWVHEFEGEEGEPPTMDNVFLLSNSFTEFLENLT